MWGGTDEETSTETIRHAVEFGVTLIDTAAGYGMGRSGEIVGKAIARHRLREKVVLAAKCALNWSDDETKVWREATRAHRARG